MRIGELARRTGVSVRSLRYYEEQNLLDSARSARGQRYYPDSAVERVALLRRMYSAGLSSRAIADVLPCVEVPGADTSDLALQRLVEEHDRLDATIDELVSTRDALRDLITMNKEHRRTLT